jgi:hypothetical protein
MKKKIVRFLVRFFGGVYSFLTYVSAAFLVLFCCFTLPAFIVYAFDAFSDEQIIIELWGEFLLFATIFYLPAVLIKKILPFIKTP